MNQQIVKVCALFVTICFASCSTNKKPKLSSTEMYFIDGNKICEDVQIMMGCKQVSELNGYYVLHPNMMEYFLTLDALVKEEDSIKDEEITTD